jgi:hypothetical protein
MLSEIKRSASDEIESEIIRQMAKACAGVRRERFDPSGLLPTKRDRHLSAGLLAQEVPTVKLQASGFGRGLDSPYWRRKFQRSNSKHPASAGAWIPLEVRDSGSAAENAGICLRIGRVTIDVKPGYDRKLLTDVLQVLESVC